MLLLATKKATVAPGTPPLESLKILHGGHAGACSCSRRGDVADRRRDCRFGDRFGLERDHARPGATGRLHRQNGRNQTFNHAGSMVGAGLQSVAVSGLVARILDGSGRVNVGQGAVMTVQGLGASLSPSIGGWIAQWLRTLPCS